MEMPVYLFPFEKIRQGSTCVIYGAGLVGQSFYQQIRMTQYCNIIAFLDRECDKYNSFDVQVISPHQVGELSFDYAIVAVEGETRTNEMTNILIKEGVPKEKIIVGSGRKIAPELYSQMMSSSTENIVYSYHEQDIVSVGMFLAGGLGDCIIAKKFILAFVAAAEKEISMDLYCDIYNDECIHSFFSDCSFVKNIILGKNKYYVNYTNYDVSLQVLSFATMDMLNDKLKYKDPVFFETLKVFQDKIEAYGLSGNSVIEAGVHFERMPYRNENCYTFFSYNGLFNIKDQIVSIPLTSSAESDFRKIDLDPLYITVNYGWGNNIHGEYKAPNKVWPFEYYEKFVEIIHEKFPKLEIVQTGMKYSKKIKGIDRYVFGERLEVLEYVLKNSLLHVDCESGLVHLATQLGTKCLVVFGPTRIETFGYPQNINIASQKCGGCRALLEDFSACLHVNNDRECMYSILPESIAEIAIKYLSKRGL